MTTAVSDHPREYASARINNEIQAETNENVVRVAAKGRQAIDARLAELDREWDIERALETNAASIVLIGAALGAFVDRRFFIVPAVVGGFLLQHALQGWCPPLPLFRRMGVRTVAEIDQERYALKALRGDFSNTRGSGGPRANATRALQAARR